MARFLQKHHQAIILFRNKGYSQREREIHRYIVARDNSVQFTNKNWIVLECLGALETLQTVMIVR